MSRNTLLLLGGCLFGISLVLIGFWWYYHSMKMISVEFTIQLTWETQKVLSLTGATNLPDGTMLQMTFAAKNGNFTHIQELEVLSGQFKSNPILFAGQPPKPGDYLLVLKMRDPFLQLDTIQAIIGEKGQYLRGFYVRKKPGESVRLAYIEQSYHLKSDAEVFGEELGKFLQDIGDVLKE